LHKYVKLKFVLIFFVLEILIIFSLSISNFNNPDEFLAIDGENMIHKSAPFPWGDIQIFNVTLNKTNIEIGEGILINATYRIILEENWSIYYISFGIKSDISFLGENIPKIMGNMVKISKMFYFEPYSINLSRPYYGYLEIVAYPDYDPSNKVVILKYSNNSIYFEKGDIQFEVIYQYPEIIFSSDDTNITIQFTNENNKSYYFSDQPVLIKLCGGSTIINYDVITDEYGMVNLLLNTSEIDFYLCHLEIYINETRVYKSLVDWSYKLYIINESDAFYFSVENENDLYVNVGFNDSNSIINLEAYCNFNASLYWNSTTGLDELTDKIGFYYYKDIITPNQSGNYELKLIADPVLPGKNLTKSNIYNIKKRPIDIEYDIKRDITNQRSFIFNISVLDTLTGNIVLNENISLFYYNYLNNNWSLIKDSLLDSKNLIIQWDIPENFMNSTLKFKIGLNFNLRYENLSKLISFKIPLITITYESFYPINTIVLLELKLEFLNGTPIINSSLDLFIGNNNWTLRTDNYGKLNFTFLTPAYETNLNILILYNESIYNSSTDLLPIVYYLILPIKMNFEQKIMINCGYIIAFFCLSIGTIFTVVKFKKPKTVEDIKIK